MSGAYSAAFTAAAKIYQGVQQKRADDQSSAVMATEAGQSIAAGIQGAIQQRRRGAYVASQAQARIAGGGLTTTGASAVNTIGQIKGQSEYNALVSVYQGEDRASELDYRGNVLRSEGNAAQNAGLINALASGASFYSKYATD